MAPFAEFTLSEAKVLRVDTLKPTYSNVPRTTT
jgi:hypothetical protein